MIFRWDFSGGLPPTLPVWNWKGFIAPARLGRAVKYAGRYFYLYELERQRELQREAMAMLLRESLTERFMKQQAEFSKVYWEAIRAVSINAVLTAEL